MDKIKQNKNYCVVYKVCSLFVCFLIIVSSLCIGAFADYQDPVNDVEFNDQPLPVIDTSIDDLDYVRNNYFLAGTLTQSGDNYSVYIGSSVSYTYSFIWRSYLYGGIDYGDGYDSSDSYSFCVFTINESSNRKYTKMISQYNTEYNNSVLYTGVGLPYGNQYTSWNVVNVPVYNNTEYGYQSIEYMIANPPAPPITPHGIDYSLPAGNVLVLDITNLNPTIYLTMTTPTLEFNVTSTQYCGVLSEIPNPINLPLTGTTPINWQAVGKKDTFGRSSSWGDTQVVSGITSDHNHAYFVVANPFSNNYTSANGSELVANPNTTINIRATNVNSGKIYQLNESFNAGTSNNTQAGDTMSVTYNDSTGLWDTINDTTGEADVPVYGGNNQGQTAITSVTEWLENISNKISSFFTGPINAIGTLVGAGSNFFRTLSGLYSWLPSPVLSVLTSALIVVITVGVIKVFI